MTIHTGSYPFVVKDGSLTPLKTVGTSEFFSDFAYGDIVSGSDYPLTSKISSDFFVQGQSRPKISALKNTLNYYKPLSQYYDYSYYSTSPLRLINIPSIFYGQSIKKGSVSCRWYLTGTLIAELQDVFRNGELIQVYPSTFISNSGTVSATDTATSNGFAFTHIVTITGSLADGDYNFVGSFFGSGSAGVIDASTTGVFTLTSGIGSVVITDTSYNIRTGDAVNWSVAVSSNGSNQPDITALTFGGAGSVDWSATLTLVPSNQIPTIEAPGYKSVAGVVLYNEGFILLTGSWDLSSDYTDEFNFFDPGVLTYTPKWYYWLGTGSNGVSLTPSSSYALDFEGTEEIPTITLLTHAERGEFNHSNNPTFVEYGQELTPFTSSNAYIERDKISLKNIVQASYNEVKPTFEKTVFISKVGIYDENKNLIAIAKLATPKRKRESESITFKLKLDM